MQPMSDTWFIYLIGLENSTRYKIGRTTDIDKRLSQLQAGSPSTLHLLWHVQAEPSLETHLHRTFHGYRVNREWFDFGEVDPLELITTIANLHMNLPQVQKSRRPALVTVAPPTLPPVAVDEKLLMQ